ncbi:hypothetical protein E5163_14285 [Marinicauda algicola]|uniref:DUF3016 domain-containing protein n=1 Tax=Marinicauda algicola TaxID=2029849 RepID=A0A4S2GXM1_9PROT|nr:hypothetical protein [Marinicauda algicola]TGY87601.1 hypothetical protein E5163_14285 [Marinicauda algicola]
MRWILSLLSLLLLTATPAAAQAGYTLGEVEAGEDLAGKVQEYGQQDVERLLDELHDAVALELDARGLRAGEDPRRIDLVLLDAEPNRPTFRQLSRNPGLSMQSFSRGGARIEAQIRGEDGQIVDRFEYDWYTRDIEDAFYRGVWTDAERAIDRFAQALADHLQAQ